MSISARKMSRASTTSPSSNAFVRQTTYAGAASIGSTNYQVPGSNVLWIAPAGDDATGTGAASNP